MIEEKEDNRCMSCGGIHGSGVLEVLNDGRKVHRDCYLGNYKYLKRMGLVGKKEAQKTLI